METGRDQLGERRERERERESALQCSPLVQGRGAWDVQMKWEAPL